MKRLVTRIYFPDEPAQRGRPRSQPRRAVAPPDPRRRPRSPTGPSSGTSCCRGAARPCSSTADGRPMRLLEPLLRWEEVEETFSDPRAPAGHAGLRGRARARRGARGRHPGLRRGRPSAPAARAERFDVAALARDAALAGQPRDPARPAAHDAGAPAGRCDAARFVHWGATSQDTIDTGLVLQLRAGPRADRGRARPAGRRPRGARRDAPRDPDRRPHLDAARGADHVRPQGRRLAGRARSATARACDELRRRALALQFGGRRGNARGARGRER